MSAERTSPHIDVGQAEREFAALERRLSNPAEQTAVQSRASTTESKEKDVEKGETQEAHFNLRDYLSSSNDAHQAAGIQHKHVGVTWEDLAVHVSGGMGSKVGVIIRLPFLSAKVFPPATYLLQIYIGTFGRMFSNEYVI